MSAQMTKMQRMSRIIVVFAIFIIGAIYGIVSHRLYFFPYFQAEEIENYIRGNEHLIQLERARKLEVPSSTDQTALKPAYKNMLAYCENKKCRFDKDSSYADFKLVVDNHPQANYRTLPEGRRDFYLAVTGNRGKDALLRLLDYNLNIVKEWVANEEIIDKRNSINIHGFVLEPDGSLVANLHDYRLVKVDRCNRQQWSVRGTHHAVTKTERGTYWTIARDIRDKEVKYTDLDGVQKVLKEQLFEIDRNGKIIRKIDLLEVIAKNKLFGLMDWKISFGGDPLHPNDVEELSKDHADAFPMFEAGDVMVNLMGINSIIVFDPKTLAVKWAYRGVLKGAHDSDFHPSGVITVLNNQRLMWTFQKRNENAISSEILWIDPKTNKHGVLVDRFFTHCCGKHEVDDSLGSFLIVETDEGRAFSYQNGELNFVYDNISDTGERLKLYGAQWYRRDYFNKLSCG